VVVSGVRSVSNPSNDLSRVFLSPNPEAIQRDSDIPPNEARLTTLGSANIFDNTESDLQANTES
jgi:hypothetical protein